MYELLLLLLLPKLFKWGFWMGSKRLNQTVIKKNLDLNESAFDLILKFRS